MPWATNYFASGAYTRFWGATTGDDLVTANAEFHAQEYPDRPRFAVVDFTATERFDVDRMDIQRIADRDIVAAHALADLVVAVIAPSLVTLGMSRMWEIQVWETGWRTKIARSRPEAFAWLAEHGIQADRFDALPI